MSKLFKTLIIVGLAGLLIGGAAGCQTTYTLRALISSPKAVTAEKGGSEQLSITAGYDKGPGVNVTASCSFKSADAAVAGVSTSGLVVGVEPGATTITVSYTESRVTKTVTVPVTVK